MMKDIDKIKQLIFSGEQCNVDLGYQLLKGLGWYDFMINDWIVDQKILYTVDTVRPKNLHVTHHYTAQGQLRRELNHNILIPYKAATNSFPYKPGIHNVKLNNNGNLIDVVLISKGKNGGWESNMISYPENVDGMGYRIVIEHCKNHGGWEDVDLNTVI